MKNKNTKKIILICIMSILVFGFIEFVLSNKDYYSIKNKGVTKKNITEIERKEKKDQQIIKYELTEKNTYIDELYLEYKTDAPMVEVKVCQGQKKCENVYKGNKIVSLNKTILSINKKTKNSYIIVKVPKENTFELSKIKVLNVLEFNVFRYLIMLFTFIFSLYALYIIKTKNKLNIPLLFLVFSLCYGTLMAFMNPIHNSWDEKEHFVRAYYTSRANIIMTHDETLPWPVNSTDFLNPAKPLKNPHGFQDFILGSKERSNRTVSDYVPVYYASTAINYLFVPYVFSGIGVMVARIFGGSLLIQYYLGRLFNLLLYSILGYFILKKTKDTGFQKFFFVSLLVPISLFQAASFSADMSTNIFAFMAVAYILAVKFQKGKASKKDLFIITASLALTTMSKLAYFPLFLLVLLIPKEKFSTEKNSKKYKIIMIILSIVLFGMLYLYSSKLGISQWEVENMDAKEQLKYILMHPLSYVAVIFNTFSKCGITYITDFTRLAYNPVDEAITKIVFFLGLYTLAITSSQKLLDKKDKWILAIAILLTFGCSLTSIYLAFNPIGNDYVVGFQARYFIPLYVPIMLLISNKNGLKYSEDKILNVSYIVLIIVYTVLMINMLNIYYM